MAVAHWIPAGARADRNVKTVEEMKREAENEVLEKGKFKKIKSRNPELDF